MKKSKLIKRIDLLKRWAEGETLQYLNGTMWHSYMKVNKTVSIPKLRGVSEWRIRPEPMEIYANVVDGEIEQITIYENIAADFGYNTVFREVVA